MLGFVLGDSTWLRIPQTANLVVAKIMKDIVVRQFGFEFFVLSVTASASLMWFQLAL